MTRQTPFRPVVVWSHIVVDRVEQNAHHALRLADRGYVMQTARVILSGTGQELLANPEVQAAYLGGGRH
jgi:branched-chain amino acid transport system ATP-binding protein